VDSYLIERIRCQSKDNALGNDIHVFRLC